MYYQLIDINYISKDENNIIDKKDILKKIKLKLLRLLYIKKNKIDLYII